MSVMEAGIPVVVAETTACPLCAHAERPSAAPTVRRRDDVLPWAIALTAAAVVTSIGLADERWFGLGAFAGLAVGAACAWYSVRAAVRERLAEKDEGLRLLARDGDERVAMVVRQFEWAVNDVAKLQRESERAQVAADLLVVQGRARERHIKKLERELSEARDVQATPEPSSSETPRAEFDADSDGTQDALAFRWGIHHDGVSARMELECDVDAHATRVRLTRFGEIRARSTVPVHTGNGSLSFGLADLPEDLIADLEAGRESGYRLEALCDYEWRPVRLVDTGRRTRIVTDKKGRLFRVSNPTLPMTTSGAFNPFDASSDSAFLTL